MINPFNRLLDRQEQQAGGADLLLATVAAVTSGGLTLIPDGETEATQKKYKYMTSAYPAPAAGDRVVVMRLSGTYVVLGRIGTSTPAADQYVRRSGDTMTGDLILDNVGIGQNLKTINLNVHPTETQARLLAILKDVASNIIGRIMGLQYTNGRAGIGIGAVRAINGSNVFNELYLLIDDSGNRYITIAEQKPWRAALGLGTNGNFPITVDQGGTGAATADANRVFAGPSSGNAAAPSFRALAASDLPTVPINKGGTGQNGLTVVTDPTEVFTMPSGFKCNFVYYAVWGKLAMVAASFKAVDAVTTSGWTTWATLVAGKRPPSLISANFTRTSYCLINSTGQIQAAAPVNPNENYTFSATYLLP